MINASVANDGPDSIAITNSRRKRLENDCSHAFSESIPVSPLIECHRLSLCTEES
jgi:hypothetical protein